MTIGVDAGALAIPDERLKLGVYWINVNLLRELGKIDRTNTYYLYSFAPIDREVLSSFGPRMVNKVLRPRRGWFSLRLPLELAAHPVDIFLGLSQSIPHSSSHNIGFLYDIGFLQYPSAYSGSQKKLMRITEDLVKRSDRIVAISYAVKDDITRHFQLEGKNITVAYPGVDETFTPVGTRYRSERAYFLFVGALKRGKNVPVLVKAFAQFLATQKTTYDLYLVGSDYWLDPDIAKTIDESNLRARVKHIGFVPDSTLAQLYRGAVAFVSPSLVEGFCLPAVEAMACATPVITSSIAVMKEVAGSAGVFVEPKDSEALGKAMDRIARDAALRAKLKQLGLSQAKEYTWRAFARTVYGLLRDH